jgi:molybdopterin-guanine dinucleotide biosynthesis protein A
VTVPTIPSAGWDARTRATHAAIVLAGGRASRLGGADKTAIEVDGGPVLDHVLAAVEGCSPVVLVGPPALGRSGVTVVREEPPFGGPVAAIATALEALRTARPAETWLLACDLPRARRIIELLANESVGDAAGVILADADGREQWLAGRYRTAALRDALSRLPELRNASLRRLFSGCPLRIVEDRDGASADLDTWAAIEHYRNMSDSPADLDAWVSELAAVFGIDPASVPTGLLLDVTRDAAHGVMRPAGPLTTYLIGLAVAGGMSPQDAAAAARGAIERHQP